MLTAEEYLSLIEDWEDPYGPLNIKPYHAGIGCPVWVVRDDLLGYGSKIRALDYLIGHSDEYKEKTEIVFGGANKIGWGPISLTYVSNQYGKKTTFFMAKRKILTPQQQMVLELRGNIIWLDFGMLSTTLSQANKYYLEDTKNRINLPLGLEHVTVIASFIKIARSIKFEPQEFWTVGSSGTLNRALQLAWPSSIAHVVQVGHNMTDKEIGRAIHHKSNYKYDVPVKNDELPPFPSAKEYDSKCWKIMLDYYKINKPIGNVLFWNVAGIPPILTSLG